MRVYKYYPAMWAREALIQQRLKLTTLTDINDPFEFRAAETTNKSFRRKIEDWRANVPRKMGLISFCQNRKNPVIWSHYADSYRGICLGFDVNDDLLHQVRYVRERIIINTSKIADSTEKKNDDVFSLLMTTKFMHWEYENEQRVFFCLDGGDIIHENSLHFVPFGENFKLREIIIGPQYCSIEDNAVKSNLKTIISKHKGCKIMTARPAFGKFEMVIQRNEPMQKSL